MVDERVKLNMVVVLNGYIRKKITQQLGKYTTKERKRP